MFLKEAQKISNQLPQLLITCIFAPRDTKMNTLRMIIWTGHDAVSGKRFQSVKRHTQVKHVQL